MSLGPRHSQDSLRSDVQRVSAQHCETYWKRRAVVEFPSWRAYATGDRTGTSFSHRILVSRLPRVRCNSMSAQSRKEPKPLDSTPSELFISEREARPWDPSIRQPTMAENRTLASWPAAGGSTLTSAKGKAPRREAIWSCLIASPETCVIREKRSTRMQLQCTPRRSRSRVEP